ARQDEWSDHGFAVITEEGGQAAMRADLAWLPRADDLVAAAHESGEGFRAFYSNGHVLEFEVASLHELATWHANSYKVVFDRGGVAEAMRVVAAREKPGAHRDAERDIRLFMGLLIIGVGRFRRGEKIIAGAGVRNGAVNRLANVIAERIIGDRPERLDTLDNYRRLELVFPKIAARIADAQEHDVETAARMLLELAEDELAPGWDGFPVAAAEAVRLRFGWV